MLSSSSCSLSSWFTSSCTYHLITVPVLTLTMSFEEPTLASDSWTDFVSAGSASVSLSPRLCTRLPIVSDLQRVSDLGARRRLCSSSTSALVAPRTVRATIGARAFPAAAASVWNSLPETVRHLHCHHYQFSAEDWRLNFFSGLAAVLPHEHCTDCTDYYVTHITVTCPCSPRTLCYVKSIRCHHHHHHHHLSLFHSFIWDLSHICSHILSTIVFLVPFHCLLESWTYRTLA